ncbi:histidine phosphatase family protein [Bacillus massiliigorillae]|uniref:histidine phosphatase family protein n=1 Tax=Bacillus massiliigorillae TaxID=1243664 RepID=UPI0003AA347E|nr:histidine phosphatase family protein [Bacillus massiliigorillae]
MERNDSIRLILIRHGMTEFNKQKKYMGYTDEPVIQERLNDYESLRLALVDESVEKIYSSDLIRCQQTARYLFDDEFFLDKRLREIHFGDWEGKTYEQLKENPAYCHWLDHWETDCIPNGECGPAFRERVLAFIQERVLLNSNRSKTIAVVSHGGVIRHIVSALCKEMKYWDVHVNFGQAIVLEVGGDWVCTSSSVVPIVESASL